MRKPEEFKIACLTNVQRLFPAHVGNCFVAGFGNRHTGTRVLTLCISGLARFDSTVLRRCLWLGSGPYSVERTSPLTQPNAPPRTSDVITYRAVGIPDSRIFIIDPKGLIRVSQGSYKYGRPPAARKRVSVFLSSLF